MVDGVLTAQAQNASGVGKADRSSARSSVQPVGRASGPGQRAFGESLTGAFANGQDASSAEQPTAGSGLLSTGVQVLLAETRSQEASAPFTPLSNVGRALNVYLETQGQVKDTIRGAGLVTGGGNALASDGLQQEISPSTDRTDRLE